MASHRSQSFFHCFSIVLLDIIFPSIPVSPIFLFTVFPPVLLNRPIVYAINLSFHFINFSSVLPWCYSISPSLPLCYLSVSNAYPKAPPTIPTVAPYKTVLLVSSMVLFPCLYSIVVTHRNRNFPLLFPLFTRALRDNGPTSEPQFFHCFFHPINFSILLLLFYLASFSKCSTQIFHCFPIVLRDIPSFFPLFFSSFSPPLQSPQVQIGGRTTGESIPHRHPIATWYITLKKFTCVRLFLPPNFVI